MYKTPDAVMENGFMLQTLSQREIEIITLLFGGYSRNEVASKLFISPNTVKNHVANANAKTNTTGTIELIKFYVDAVLVSKGLRPFSELCKEEDTKDSTMVLSTTI